MFLVTPLSYSDTLGCPEQNIEEAALNEVSDEKDIIDDLRLHRKTEGGNDIWRNIFSDIKGYMSSSLF